MKRQILVLLFLSYQLSNINKVTINMKRLIIDYRDRFRNFKTLYKKYSISNFE